MPGLKLFGRRWGIASDDFVFPGGFEVFFRLVWLLFIVLAYFLAVDPVDPNTCGDHYSELNAFLVCSMVLQGIVFVNATIIVIISALGTLSVERPRRHIRVFLYVRCFLLLPEAILATFGAYYIASSAILGLDTCPIFVQAVCLLGVILSFTVLFVTMIIVQCIFDPLGASQKIRDKQRLELTVSHDSQSLNDRRRVETSNLWETRLRRLCCCFISDTEGNRHALKDVAELMTEMFEVDMDVVPSDIAAGLVLVQRQQDSMIFTKTSPQPILGSPAKPLPWMTATNVFYFAKYAMSIYGWPLFVYMNPVSGCCRILNKLCCCRSSITDSESEIVGDNCCRSNAAGLAKILDLPHVKILFCSFHNEVFNSPFFIAVDDEAKSIVISIRGSMSFMDAITDVMTQCAPIFEDELPTLQAHRGILTTANNIYNCLKQKKLLEMAREGRTDYAIVTTGHSLGAGVAVILALKLKNHFDNVSLGEPAPEIQSFAFSPPGGLLSRDACRLSRECVMSVVLDMDFIPRLSYHTFLHLKDELIREIKKADEPKFEILAKGCWSAFGRCAVECCGDRRQAQASRFEKDGDNQSEERTTSPLSLDDNDQNPLLWTGQQPSYNSEPSTLSADVSIPASNSDILRDQPKLYPPGHILLLKEPEKTVAHGKWVGPEYLQEIIVGTTMMTDHLPDRILQAVTSYKETQISGLSVV